MIVYKLKCENAHEFDGWFKSIESFDEQIRSMMIVCPTCGSQHLEKVLTSTKSLRSGRSLKKTSKSADSAYAVMKKIAENVRRNFENVGKRFPEEARKIHYGEVPAKNIYGVAGEKEEKSLKDEGIEFFKFPLIRDEDD